MQGQAAAERDTCAAAYGKRRGPGCRRLSSPQQLAPQAPAPPAHPIPEGYAQRQAAGDYGSEVRRGTLWGPYGGLQQSARSPPSSPLTCLPASSTPPLLAPSLPCHAGWLRRRPGAQRCGPHAHAGARLGPPPPPRRHRAWNVAACCWLCVGDVCGGCPPPAAPSLPPHRLLTSRLPPSGSPSGLQPPAERQGQARRPAGLGQHPPGGARRGGPAPQHQASAGWMRLQVVAAAAL